MFATVWDCVATPICSILTSTPKQSKSQQSKQIKWSFLSEKETRNGWQCSVSKFDEVTLVKFIASSYSLGCRPSICKRCNLTTVTKLSANSCYLYIDIGSFYRSCCFSLSPPFFSALILSVWLFFLIFFFIFSFFTAKELPRFFIPDWVLIILSLVLIKFHETSTEYTFVIYRMKNSMQFIDCWKINVIIKWRIP